MGAAASRIHRVALPSATSSQVSLNLFVHECNAFMVVAFINIKELAYYYVQVKSIWTLNLVFSNCVTETCKFPCEERSGWSFFLQWHCGYSVWGYWLLRKIHRQQIRWTQLAESANLNICWDSTFIHLAIYTIHRSCWFADNRSLPRGRARLPPPPTNGRPRTNNISSKTSSVVSR